MTSLSDWRDSWSHYVFVKNENQGTMVIYHNGQPVADKTGVSTSTLINVRNNTFKIGATVSHNNDYKGRMDDFRIYDYALSAPEVVALFTDSALAYASKANPSNGGEDVCPDAVFTWSPGGFAESHDIYFGTDLNDVNDANTTVTLGVYRTSQTVDANSYDPPGLLEYETTYYWRIDEVNSLDANSPWKGSVWHFTVEDGKARAPDPGDGSSAVPVNKVLGWTPSCFASSHDVYFGTDSDDVNGAGDPNVLPGRGRQQSNSYDPCGLQVGTTYYWRIDEVNGPNIVTGDTWSFTAVDSFINSLGMEMVRIEAGAFSMGSTNGDFDEEPLHNVTITQPFYTAKCEVTNAQYEQFDPNHSLIDHRGFTHEANEAAIFVSWEDANAFCAWLSQTEGVTYRLPTEAEWEYACRAGTTTKYHTGDTLPAEFQKNAVETWGPYPVPLDVGQTTPNPWGLCDTHGNVEEWCYDWYGPYEAGDQDDPVGRANGHFRVSRGGSHSTTLNYLRSANRMGTLPQDKHWLIGFRVVMASMPATEPLPEVGPQPYQIGVSQTVPPDINDGPDPCVPYFYGPRRYVWIPSHLNGGPLFSNHNHVPALVQCPNGDLLAIWYSTIREPGRELAIAASRLRYGQDQWDDASLFWNGPDRNDHASAFWIDETGKIWHFNGLGDGATWGALATVLRTSTDNGVTWSTARLIMPRHRKRQMPIESVFRTSWGSILLACDAVRGGVGGTVVWFSEDNGPTWYDPGEGMPDPVFSEGGTGAWIAGIHAGIAELADTSLLAYGRGDNINGMMPRSVSADYGYNWTYSASEFQPIGGGRRLVLLRLKEGPLFFASFSVDMPIVDESGGTRNVSGLFGALSYDDGQIWPYKRLISDDGEGRSVETTDGSLFTMSIDNAEPRGYLSVHQAKNDVIHLISSREHYEFNYKWLATRPPASTTTEPNAVNLPGRDVLSDVFEMTDYPSNMPGWRWTGSGVEEANVVSFPQPGVILIDTNDGQRARWANDDPGGFDAADENTGFTAEIKMRVLKSTSGSRGIDFEAYTGDGSASGHRYFVTITTTGLHWHDGSFGAIVEGLDNSSEMHTYRMSVRDDQIVQIYRDLELLDVKAAAHSVDGMLGATGPYFQCGEGAGASEADAEVEYVAFDLSGPYGPKEPCHPDFAGLADFCLWWLSRCRSPDWCEGFDIDRSMLVDFGDFAAFAPQIEVCP
ncbi:MAG: SUMF1/EgtB/PvdO family nonheme iron enzyme [Planctomycetota bacterium]